MGLDSVELVMEFEETFGVELTDEEVVKTTTPREVGDLVFSKLKDPRSSCPKADSVRSSPSTRTKSPAGITR